MRAKRNGKARDEQDTLVGVTDGRKEREIGDNDRNEEGGVEGNGSVTLGKCTRNNQWCT